MKRLLFFFIAGIVPLWFACDDDDDDTPVNIPSVEVGDTFSLKFGECVHVNADSVSFLLCFADIIERRYPKQECDSTLPFVLTDSSRTLVLLKLNGSYLPWLMVRDFCRANSEIWAPDTLPLRTCLFDSYRTHSMPPFTLCVYRVDPYPLSRNIPIPKSQYELKIIVY